jgi:hypothetical protein
MDGCMGRAAVSHKPLRVLTWHVHANYLYYLTQVPHHYLSTRPGRAGHSRRSGGANAEERFNIDRFVADWMSVFRNVSN